MDWLVMFCPVSVYNLNASVSNKEKKNQHLFPIITTSSRKHVDVEIDNGSYLDMGAEVQH